MGFSKQERLYNCILCAILEPLDLLNYFRLFAHIKVPSERKTLWILMNKLGRVFTITVSYE